MNNNILSIPVEILTRIFERFDDFTQVIAFASTCKHTYSAWVEGSSTIIWNVANSQIRSFDDALMAVRATAIVLEAYKAAILPPAVTMISLSGKTKLPDLEELKEVLNVQYLVWCLEYMYFHSTVVHTHSDDKLLLDMKYTYPTRKKWAAISHEGSSEVKEKKIEFFRDNFYRAMYRLLIASAVLARVYMAPLFKAREEGGKNAFFATFGIDYGTNWYDETLDDVEQFYATEDDVAYLRQFPVYNFDVADSSETGQWKNQEYETCFGEFASWIISDGRTRAEAEPQSPEDIEPDWAENKSDIGAMRELMLLLVAYNHFNVHFQNSIRKSSTKKPSYCEKPGNRTVTIVRFGHFKVEEITMPAVVEDLTDNMLYAASHPDLEGTAGQDIQYHFDVWYAMWFLQQRIRDPGFSYRREKPWPAPTLEFWIFALRHYLNLGFKPETFWIPRSMPEVSESIWYGEVGRGTAFLDPNWAPVQRYRPGYVSWYPENNRVH